MTPYSQPELTHSLQLTDWLNLSWQLAKYQSQSHSPQLANCWARIPQTRISLIAFRITHLLKYPSDIVLVLL